jgi:hypothetical protein
MDQNDNVPEFMFVQTDIIARETCDAETALSKLGIPIVEGPDGKPLGPPMDRFLCAPTEERVKQVEVGKTYRYVLQWPNPHKR